MKILIVDDEPMVLEETRDIVTKVRPEAEICLMHASRAALEIAEKERFDVAMLDIEMPGINGLELAGRLKELNPAMNIIFVTAYSEYAVDAFSLYVSGYLMKPLRRQDVEKAFENLRYPMERIPGRKLRVQCFGNFEVFADGRPVNFARAKAKELFAYLVDLQGATANTAELCAVLWEDSATAEKNRHYLRNLIADIRRALRECDAEEVFISQRNRFAIDPEGLDCDYYRFLKKDAAAVNSYRGEYMKQYSWAEFSIGIL